MPNTTLRRSCHRFLLSLLPEVTAKSRPASAGHARRAPLRACVSQNRFFSLGTPLGLRWTLGRAPQRATPQADSSNAEQGVDVAVSR